MEMITLYPSLDKAEIEPRSDGFYNLHNQETSATTWGMTKEQIDDLRKRSADIQRLAAQEEADDLRIAINKARAEALPENKHRKKP